MQISARNQLRGKITAVRLGAVMAEVTVDVGGGNTLVSTITKSSAESMDLREGQEVVAVIKATEVMIGK
ncbi:MAG TPA: TOBE domain-containing protein [Thermoanaerobaculia bacterium]|jgi:molybdopterin-binding protein|nr:TOBE domain-containing protein [Thermoanaerobaculia bacterium]